MDIVFLVPRHMEVIELFTVYTCYKLACFLLSLHEATRQKVGFPKLSVSFCLYIFVKGYYCHEKFYSIENKKAM